MHHTGEGGNRHDILKAPKKERCISSSIAQKSRYGWSFFFPEKKNPSARFTVVEEDFSIRRFSTFVKKKDF